MPEKIPHQPQAPERAVLRAWLSDLSLNYVHTQGWEEVNAKFHDFTLIAREFALERYPDEPDTRQAFLDGYSFGLLGLIHDAGIKDFAEQLFASDEKMPRIPEPRTSGENAAASDLPPAV
jgi:hypothetical protein